MEDCRQQVGTYPVGLVTGIEGLVAHVWVFTRNTFPENQVDINFEKRKQKLETGMWIFLKYEESGNIRYKKLPDECVAPCDAVVNVNGIVEVTTNVVFSSGQINCNEKLKALFAWSPLLGPVGAIFNHSTYPDCKVFQATLRRVSQSILGCKMHWAVRHVSPIEEVASFEKDSGDVPLEERNVIHIAVVVEEDDDSFLVWSRAGRLTRIPKRRETVALGDFVKYSAKLNCIAGLVPFIDDYHKIDKPYESRCVNGIVQVKAGAPVTRRNNLNSSLHSQLLGTVDSSAVWMSWHKGTWKIVPGDPESDTLTNSSTFSNENSVSSFETGERPKDVRGAPESHSAAPRVAQSAVIELGATAMASPIETDESRGIVMRDKDVLFVAPFAGSRVVCLHDHLQYGDGDEVKIGDWVVVRAGRDKHLGAFVSVDFPRLITPLLESRVAENGEVQVRTIITNLRKENFDAYGDSLELGRVKDIYEALTPRSSPSSRYLTWCHHVALPDEDCNWALVKGEDFFTEEESMRRAKDGAHARASSSLACSSKTARVSAAEFVRSARHIFGCTPIREMIRRAYPEVFDELCTLLD